MQNDKSLNKKKLTIQLIIMSVVEGLVCSLSLFIFFQDTFSPKKTLLIFLFAWGILSLLLFLLNNAFVVKTWKKTTLFQKQLVLFLSLLISLVLGLVLNNNIPAINLLNYHTLEIYPNFENPNSHNQTVEIQSFSSGVKWESLSSFKREGKWEESSESLLTTDTKSSLSWFGNISKKPTLFFHGRPDGGTVKIVTDGNDQGSIDLSKNDGEIVDVYLTFNTSRDIVGKVSSDLLLGLSIAFVSFLLLLLFIINEEYEYFTRSLKDNRVFNFLKKISNVNKLWFYIILILICSVICYLQIGNFNSRMGSVNGDDAPVVYSLFFEHPDRFSSDILTTYGYQQLFATILNIIPALLFRYFSISPYSISLFLVYIQYILLGISVFRLSVLVSGRQSIGWMATLVVFAASPWDWNLANYGNVMFIPYAGHFVMSFVLLAFADIILEKNLRAMLWLFLGGLVHPSMVLYALGMIAIYWLITRKFKLLPWVFLFANILITILPRLLLIDTFTSSSLLSFDEMRVALIQNLHMPPLDFNKLSWRNNEFFYFLPLVFISLREIRTVNKIYKWLLASIFAGCLLLVIASWFGWSINNLSIIQLIPNRATQVFVFSAFPLILTYFHQNLSKNKLLNQLCSLVFLLALCDRDFINTPYYLAGIAILLILDIFSGVFGPITFMNKRKEADQEALRKDSSSGSTILAIQKLLPVLISLVLITGATFYSSYKFGEQARTDKAQANYEIQKWVAENTPENSKMINMGRTVTQRAIVNTEPYNWYVYNRSKPCKDYIDRLNAFYNELRLKSDKKVDVLNLNESQLTQFAHEFGGEYILRSIEKPLAFSEAYRNKYYVVYKIPE